MSGQETVSCPIKTHVITEQSLASDQGLMVCCELDLPVLCICIT